MENSRLAQFLFKEVKIDSKFAAQLLNNLKLMAVPKGAFVLKMGEIANCVYFIESGLLRYYSVDNSGKDHILQFVAENNFIGNLESILTGDPSRFYIQALEKTIVIVLEESFFLQFIKRHPNLSLMNKMFLRDYVVHLQNRVIELLSFSAEQRYEDFMKQYPGIITRIPQLMLASYLGITPESLSRIRREFQRKM
ncbi:MAG: Crp/Fnr family transcriptional regulator [Chitinophaga sp.]|uniref:Crp/Fnr family transcriptional regulator n=1 Tax=Chitinophaga sp. TaxID=1869181 RepID=UPI0025C22FC6|nr:Crp/Fnr family transcriptional regulator [Chitinophaga sp.]MBV8251406.1 Crp/Fnr family transcriptional regulator [Chitinophaga sp.]